ncbi:folylpolyglutamate synthase/dihydrofolate synthase family protein [Acidaminococcus fermentans]|uniref:bifunctional folylpolyglutamate synthase/dihydrofolate synthase n=1 Tax=Acidaminococcus fermentans TaxID=905 RepID=UPI002E7A53E4|nr:folylpolyglutamate synthase/dihydrofolate synthase family protein [Acidaminococcus fermentans]MEE1598471.1 folylpolyglutamate synthase/dihydrofolate synthase family protein [Acidaminococcus fermentans]MEE4122733.1 folylpolyglutamate synthase/dihydrofolate synthase family protein [Acidaminococcus fermentans]
MEYADAVDYVESLGKFGIHLGMERIQGLTALLDHPERKIRTVHVTGTNGKGSVTTFLANMLQQAGLKVGSYTSPHFVRYNERICLNGEEISNEDFAAVTEKTKAALDRFLAQGGEQPTQFEFITAMAFLYFAEKQVDCAVIEVGMGGLWDSTNIITPEVSVITNVTLEHTERLGKTIEAIAAQKAGIIKPGVPVVTEAEGKALEVIRGAAEANHAPLYVYGDDFSTEELTSSMDTQTFLYRLGEKKLEVAIHLPGEHQILNGAAALTAAEILRDKHGVPDEAAMLRGMEAARWPGRLERIHRNPDIILDGAHNPSGVTVLRKALDEYYPKARRIYVFGMMADKDVSQVSDILFRPEDTIYTVLAHEGDRSEKPEKLAQRLHKNAVPMENLTAAYQRAVSEAGPEDVVIVCGSLYLIGTFKELGLDR